MPRRHDTALNDAVAALVFVYGTLKQGFPNFARNPGRRVGCIYRTCSRYPFYVVRLPSEERAPWLVDRPGEGEHVLGQVFEVDDATLAAMDNFEEVGLPQGYLRIELELEAVDGTGGRLRAFTYTKDHQQLASCLAVEGPFAEYTADLAAGYRLDLPP